MSSFDISRVIVAMPAHLAERATPRYGSTINRSGEFVLLHLHHALRVDENPALDAARVISAEFDLPLLIYQGLGGAHRYNSDRHHAFIIESARDLAHDLEELGLRLAFHLGPPDGQPGPLGALFARAAISVVEDFPAPPFPRWTRALAARARGPVVAVDAACIVPQRFASERYERAFEFRRAHLADFETRRDRPWPRSEARVAAFDGGLGFAPVDLDRIDVDAALAALPIDHTLPPVAATRGGSRAALARWSAFKADGLARYAELRNDAAITPPLGVSRMSPYLHFGCIAATRIAREAHASRSRGADKFLDELFVWREVAFNFCRHTDEPERLDALPAWAIATLGGHAEDPRPALYGDDDLASGTTGERLWDLAQRSLLIHGELHNNLRMTWGKSLLPWSRSAEQALARLIDLNHRHALDGSDPASYGGLLWCLGLYDRPFKPALPVIGTTRPRPLDGHARRIDIDAYARHIARPNGRRLAVAVIGAGIAGSAAARALIDQGHRVVVFEKSRGAGGRMATRRTPFGPMTHGARVIDAPDPRMDRWCAAWRDLGLIAPLDDSAASPLFEAVAESPAIAKRVLRDIPLSAGSAIVEATRVDDAWVLRDADGGARGGFDALVVATPAPQALPLVGDSAALSAALARVRYAPTWTLMAAVVDAPSDSGAIPPSPLATIDIDAAQATSPARALIVADANAAWSQANLERPAAEVAAELWSHVAKALALDSDTAPLSLEAHRWRYARVVEPVGVEALFDRELMLAVVGDGVHGDGAGRAFLSGQAGAGYLLRAAARLAHS